ncbi:MAG: hypothetical protein CIT02_10530 [Methanobacterium sp. BAmetb5]|nr:MAG: hypothetical protein CIT02_10530 [Methanobacterium sp. BAmetb5]
MFYVNGYGSTLGCGVLKKIRLSWLDKKVGRSRDRLNFNAQERVIYKKRTIYKRESMQLKGNILKILKRI